MATPPDFSPGQVLTAAHMDAVGLWKIAETSFTNAANPFINGCFSSNYQNYVIKVFVQAASLINLNFRMRSGVSTVETGAVYDRFGFRFDGGITSLVTANLTSAYIGDVAATGNNRSAVTIDMFGPNDAIPTIANTHGWDSNAGSIYFPSFRIETNTQYTGIELFPSSSTLTGTMRVYGYRN